MSDWTKEAIERAKVLWESHSFKQISVKLAEEGFGEFSRGAVIGKLHRLGITKKPELTSLAPRVRPTKEPVGSIAFKVIHAIKRKRKQSGLKRELFVCQDSVEIEPRHISLMELNGETCRWPYGDGPFTFCGNLPSACSPYCLAHTRIAFGAFQTARKAA